MNTTPEALKQLYVALGGDSANVSDVSTNVEALKFIYTQLGGTEDVSDISNIPDIIEFISTQATGTDGDLYKHIMFRSSESLAETLTIPGNSVVALPINFQANNIPEDYYNREHSFVASYYEGNYMEYLRIAGTDIGPELSGNTVYIANTSNTQREINSIIFKTHVFYR